MVLLCLKKVLQSPSNNLHPDIMDVVVMYMILNHIINAYRSSCDLIQLDMTIIVAL